MATEISKQQLGSIAFNENVSKSDQVTSYVTSYVDVQLSQTKLFVHLTGDAGIGDLKLSGDLVVGQTVSSDGDGSIALGRSISSIANNAFVWNGTSSQKTLSTDKDGSFNIFPENGISGLYVAGTSMYDQIKSQATEICNDKISQALTSITFTSAKVADTQHVYDSVTYLAGVLSSIVGALGGTNN